MNTQPVDTIRHGTSVGYTYWRCRCPDCRAENAARSQLHRDRVRRGEPRRTKGPRTNWVLTPAAEALYDDAAWVPTLKAYTVHSDGSTGAPPGSA